MTNLNILIVEGNDPKNNEFFIKAAKSSCSENLKKLVLKLEPDTKIEIISPTLLKFVASMKNIKSIKTTSITGVRLIFVISTS